MYVPKAKVEASIPKNVSVRFKAAPSSQVGNVTKQHKDIVLRIRPKTMTCIRTFNNQYRSKLPRGRPPLHTSKNCSCCQKLDSHLPNSSSMADNMARGETSTTENTDDDDSPQDELDDARRNHSYPNINNPAKKKPGGGGQKNHSLSHLEERRLADEVFSKGQTKNRQIRQRHSSVQKILTDTSTHVRMRPYVLHKYERNFFKSYGALSIIALMLLAFVWFCFNNTLTKSEPFDLDGEILKLGRRYGQSMDFWDRITSSLVNTNRSEDVAVFLFVYIHSHLGFTVLEFTKDIAKIAATYFNEYSIPTHPIVVGPLEVDDPDFLVNYRETLKTTRSMVVRNVNLLPGNAVRPFHFFCDEYNPLVRKSAIFLTLDVTDCKGDIDLNELEDQNTLVEHTEQCLVDTWRKSLASEYLKALVARVVNVVLLVDTTNMEVFSP